MQKNGLADLEYHGSQDMSSLDEKLEKQTYKLVDTQLRTLSKKLGPLLRER